MSTTELDVNNVGLSPADLKHRKRETHTRTTLRKFMRHKPAVAGLWIMVLLSLAAVFAPLISPYDPYKITGSFAAAPSREYWLGTDQTGRDVLSRLIYAARVSLTVGLGSEFIGVVIGTITGLFSGYCGRLVDAVIMRITDIFLSFPRIMLVMVVVSLVGSSLMNLIVVLGLLSWTSTARLVRGGVLSLKQADFTKASIALGYGTPRILFRHILPNVVAPILVSATFGIAGAILTEASLSFLGLGVQPPAASWGNMLRDAQSLSVLVDKPWLWIPPGLMIVISVLSVNFIGDGLRDALDPKGNG